MKVLAIVPARCGSKGFPDKNIAKIAGKTLLELAVNVGLESSLVDDVYVSTDCEKYESIAIKGGAKSLGLRPAALATDSAKSIDAIIDLLTRINEDYSHVVLLQPTSPVRTPEDIENMLRLMEENNADASVSMVKLEEPHPYKLKSIDQNGFITPFIEGTTSEVPRQSLPEAYALNGALYITRVETILKEKTFLPKETVPYIMSENINIDTEEDFIFMQAMYDAGKINLFGAKQMNREQVLNIAERFAVNIKQKNGELDVLLGHNDHILSNYKRDNVKLIGGWYHENIDLNVDFLVAVIEKYKIRTLNFIGASKSCSGEIILAKGIIRAKIKTPKMNLFMFSAYTSIDKEIYEKRRLIDKVPGSLIKLWDSEEYTKELIKEMELRRLVGNKHIEAYLFYPTRSSYGEKILASRIEGDNIHHIELPVYMHNTLYPMWKNVDQDRTIEIYENIIKKMHKDDHQFYLAMQNHKSYKFHLYSILENPEEFKEHLANFIIAYKAEHDISY